MRASIKNQIAPPVSQPGFDFSPQKSVDKTKKTMQNKDSRTSFKDLITNSNSAIREEREAKKTGDYSNLSEEEFLERLQKDSQPKRTPKNTLDKNDFLKLFVAQLQHQDPLNPDDGAEMASKLAQFNSLEQAMNTNTNLDKLLKAQNSAQSHALVNYIGKEVEIEGGHIKMKNGELNQPKFTLNNDAASITLTVRDGSGIKVVEKEMGSMNRGTHTLSWDGKNQDGQKIPNGSYRFYLKAKTLNNETLDIPLTTSTKITGIDLKDKDGMLFTDFGRKPFSGVSSIGMQNYQNADLGKQIKQSPPTKTNKSTKQEKPQEMK